MKVKKYARGLLVMIAAIAVVCSTIMLAGCSEATVEDGDTVKVLYVGTFDDGEVFDSSELHGDEPLQFTIGGGETIPGFEQAITGMKVNEVKNVHIQAEDAYGLYYEDLIFTLNWSQLEEGFIPEAGDELYTYNQYGQTITLIVMNVSDDGVMVDANHPLAGFELNFEITLVEIVKSE
ncbi:MAG: FKBP-type peptidyl-prolyl cis-trans isomerase [Chloroflexota bacterium]|nr:FKBP-type peptidyl-prolyl cis-trans isomerase [Chloroflexota bacterium]